MRRFRSRLYSIKNKPFIGYLKIEFTKCKMDRHYCIQLCVRRSGVVCWKWSPSNKIWRGHVKIWYQIVFFSSGSNKHEWEWSKLKASIHSAPLNYHLVFKQKKIDVWQRRKYRKKRRSNIEQPNSHSVLIKYKQNGTNKNIATVKLDTGTKVKKTLKENPLEAVQV